MRPRPAVPRRLRALAAVAVGAAGLAGLTGCTGGGTVSLSPAPQANDPACADVIVRLPDQLDDQPKRDTDSQSTAAWGNPATVLLRCGIPPLGPNTLPCTTIDGVDWVADDSQAPLYRFISYGRAPSVEVIIDGDTNVASSTVFQQLAQAVSTLPKQSQCTDATDLDLGGSTPAP